MFSRLKSWEALGRLQPLQQPLIALLLLLEAKTRVGSALALSTTGTAISLLLSVCAGFLLFSWVSRYLIGRVIAPSKWEYRAYYGASFGMFINAGVLADSPNASVVLVGVYLFSGFVLWWGGFLDKQGVSDARSGR